MFYIIALDNKEFIAKNEELGDYTVPTKEEATIYNEAELKRVFEKNVRGDYFITLNGDKKIKSVICYGFIAEHNDVEAFIKKLSTKRYAEEG